MGYENFFRDIRSHLCQSISGAPYVEGFEGLNSPSWSQDLGSLNLASITHQQ